VPEPFEERYAEARWYSAPELLRTAHACSGDVNGTPADASVAAGAALAAGSCWADTGVALA
jgi:hypothetical protein